VKAAEAALHQPSLDGSPPKPRDSEIGGRDDTVPSGGEVGNHPIGVTHRAPTGQTRRPPKRVSTFWPQAV
jgi:hypothetical protein